MGYKNFVAGTQLLESDLDLLLMRQTVMVFANAAARDSALSGILTEGMMAFLQDVDQTWYYNGTAWRRHAGRQGCELTNTSFAIGATSAGTVTFSTEGYDDNGFHSGSATSITVPTACDGVYLCSIRASVATPVNGLTTVSMYANGAFLTSNYIPVGGVAANVGLAVNLPATQYIECLIFNGHSATLNWNVTMVAVKT